MARRNQYDPLQTVNQVMWLVIKDAGLGTALSCRALPPKTDLKAALTAERLKHVDGGWDADPLTRYSFVFCKRGNERIYINIQPKHPDEPTIGHGTHLCGNAPGR
jgi:hypothetical protein